MRRLVLVLALAVLPTLSACASQHEAAVKRSIDGVVRDETQRQKVIQAVNAGATPDEALAKAAGGPKNEQPPSSPADPK
jgi:hypothetical protein